MDNLEKLLEISNYLGLSNITAELENIDLRSHQENANLILPLVGEFSSGKTSSRVPSTTILVDTPGLSSPNPKHKQTLVNFLPKADGIMLVTDINQQITRSLTDFIETIKLSKRPIYLILTKSDTKSDSDIASAKQYISNNCHIPLTQMAVVSAATDYIDEFYAILDSIQKDKKDF